MITYQPVRIRQGQGVTNTEAFGINIFANVHYVNLNTKSCLMLFSICTLQAQRLRGFVTMHSKISLVGFTIYLANVACNAALRRRKCFSVCTFTFSVIPGDIPTTLLQSALSNSRMQ